MGEPSDPPDRAARDAVLASAATGALVIGPELEAEHFGRYDVVASIGRGGMGEVYLARRNDKPGAPLVALKVLVADDTTDDDLVAMFMDEAAIMAQILHPNVLEVLDFGRDGDRYYLAMEYLAGRPLVRVMIDGYAKDQGFEQGVIAAIGAHAARGLDAAHSAVGRTGQPLQVVHRDVSPQNLFVTYAGNTKVLDFGVARAAERLARTTAGQLKGKAAYMSPEQVHGQLVDRRSDVFSLGVCLWEMTAGRRLFKRDTEWDTITAVANGPIMPPSEVQGERAGPLDGIILQALEREPKRRFQTAGEMAAALERMSVARLGPAPHEAVAKLMQRLYGEEAGQEQRLVAELSARAPNASELATLRRLSGISPRPSAFREITLASAPASLRELDHFGEEDRTPRGQIPKGDPESDEPSTGPVAVQRAVAAIAKEHASRIERPPATPAKKGLRRTKVLAAVVLALTAGLSLLGWLVAVLIPEELLIGPAGAPLEEELPAALQLDPIAVVVNDADVHRLRGVIGDLEMQGVTAVVHGSEALLGGEDGETLRVALNAEATPVEGGSVGYVLTSTSGSYPRVAWVGTTSAAEWGVRAISVNDCPAIARVTGDGLLVQYGGPPIRLPFSGGPLSAVRLPRPSFADRLEVQPLGIALGAARAGQAAVQCTSGWDVGGGVQLERLPPGEYTLTWTGTGRESRATLHVGREGR